MKKYLLLRYLTTVLIVFTLLVNIAAQQKFKNDIFSGAQAKEKITEAAYIEYKPGRTYPQVIRLAAESKVTPMQFDSWIHKSLKLSADIQFRKVEKPKLSEEKIAKASASREKISSNRIYTQVEHSSFKQFYKGVPIEYSEYKVHSKENLISSVTGNILDFTPVKTSTKPSLSADQALNKALGTLDYTEYAWQNKNLEHQIKEQKKSQTATFYPTGDLMWYNQNGNLHLVYRFDIRASSPSAFFRIYVDANNGIILSNLPMESNCDPTTFTSIFNGTRTISTSQISPTEWRPYDQCFVDEIFIYDWNSATCTDAAVDVPSSNNTWTTMNQRFAASVLFNTREASNYWYYIQGRWGYDGAFGDLNGYINAVFDGSSSPGCQAYTDNASMSFSGGTMKVGLGSGGTLDNSWSTIDILGHEYTHAVTGSSAGLVYSYESGALNESFSDIFGEATERYTLGSNDWLMGDERTDGAIRSMSNPNTYGQPDTYLGTYWYTGSGDNGGVHYNSGVQNFWFYLLSNGGTGTNDNGDSYAVVGLTMATAEFIASQTLQFYLGSNDEYADARDKSIQAAIDNYGACSNEVKQVTNAWHAVGVGDAYPEPSATVFDPVICTGETIQLYSSGGVSYLWSGPAGFSTSIQNPTRTNALTTYTGLYTVTVTFSDGCTDEASVNVTVNPTPVATPIPILQTICSGTSITPINVLSNVGGTTFNWTRTNSIVLTGIPSAGNSNPVSGSLTNTGSTIQSTIFTFTPTANGCVGNNVNATVTVNPKPTVTATPASQEVCSGKPIQTIVMSGTVTGTTYNWTRDNPQITGIANAGSGNISGTLTNNTGSAVTVTFTITPVANGCSGDPKTATVLVYPLPPAAATASPNPVCQGELMWFSATGGVAYKWSGPGGFTFDGGAFGRHMQPSMAGTYYVTVTSSAGCTKTASVAVSVKPAPVASISINPNPACTGNTVQLSSSGGTSYNWSGPFGFNSTQQNPQIVNSKLYHSGTYSVTVTGANGCTAVISDALKVNETPVGSAWFDATTACTGSTLQLYATGGGTYQWSGPAGFSSNLQNPTRPNLSASHSGIYTVVITGIYGGCTASYSVNVQVHPLPTVTAWTTTPEVCEGDAAYLFSSGASTYDWVGPYGYHSTFQNPIVYNIPTYMEGIYTVTGSSVYGCTSKASVYIDVQSVNAIVNATPNPVPYGGTLYLTASGGTYYQWTGPNGFHTNFQNPIIYKFTQVNAGLYTCIVSTSAGCQDTEIILVSVKNNSVDGDTPIESRKGKYAQVYPNPASNSIKVDADFSGDMNYTIINSIGNVVQKGMTQSEKEIDIHSLSSGSYYIQWTYTKDGKSESFISKFIRTN